MNYRELYNKILSTNENKSESDYKEVIEELEKRAGNPPDRSLLRFTRAQELLKVGSFPVINIVGTNGKGTVAKTIYDCCRAFNIDTGLFISPHLIEYRERIRSFAFGDNEFISNFHLFELVKLVNFIEEDIKPKYGSFTYFEVLSLVASIYFQYLYSQGKLKFVILEAGVGGRFDVTKAIGYSLISVITSISIDHKDYLGDNASDIAWHKAGIIAANSIVLTLNEKWALDEIEKEAIKMGAKLYTSDAIKVSPEKQDGHFIVKFKNNFIRLNPLQVGIFCRENYPLAAATMIIIMEMIGVKSDILKLENTINSSNWDGRIDTIAQNPITILDGAHNEDAITKLYNYFSNKSIISVVACMNTKEHQKMAKFIKEHSKEVIATSNGNEKSVNLDELKIETGAKKTFHNPIDAINYARSIASKDDIVLVSGSLYLVGLVLCNKHDIF